MLSSGEKKRTGIIALILYVLLLLDSGFYFVAKGRVALIVQLFLALALMLICAARVSKKTFLVFYILITLTAIGTLFSGDAVRDFAVSVIELSTGFCIACAFLSKRSAEAVRALRVVMMAICIGSLVAFLLTSMKVGFVSRLPVFISENGTKCYFWGLSFSYVPGEYYVARNLGLFWEPGAFQTYLILALTGELFCGKKRMPKIVYTVTMLTTLSSTGIICMLFLWILYGFSKKNKVEGVFLLLVLFGALLLFYSNLDFLPESVRFNIIDKVQSALNGNDKGYVTVATRMDSIRCGLELLLQLPIFGIGRGLEALKIAAGNDIVSCTPVNWLLQYGILFGCIALAGLFKSLQRVTTSSLHRIALFLVILISVSTEAFNMSPTFFFLVFVGFETQKNNVAVQSTSGSSTSMVENVCDFAPEERKAK